MDVNTQSTNVCKCTHHRTVPILVMLIGVAFLLNAVGIMDSYTLSIMWPILVIIASITKVCEHKCACC